MSERARQLHASAGRQIGALIEIASALDETSLRFAYTGRAKSPTYCLHIISEND